VNRRRFLQLAAGAGVTAATMAEVGFFAEFMVWVKRLPVWSIPKTAGGTLNVLTADKVRTAVDALQNATPSSGFVGIIHPYVALDLQDDFAGTRLSHLSLRELATVYYDKKAIENLKHSMPFSEACREIEASVSRVKSGNFEMFQYSDNPKRPPGLEPPQRRIDHYDEERMSYTKNDKGEIMRAVFNETTRQVDLLPTSSPSLRPRSV
jgi:hypothetical protein